MSMCRACLKSLRIMIPFDEKYIMYFNIFTSLNIKLSSDVPQKLCKRCYKTLQLFVEFREKCIAADSAFSDIIPEESIKKEDEGNHMLHDLEIKLEIDNTLNEFSYEDDNNYCHYEEEDSKLNINSDLTHENEDSKLNINSDLTHEVILKTEEEEYKNEICVKDITKKNKRKIKRVKVSETNFPCGLCTESFESKTLLELHLPTHIKSNTCSICFDKFNDWQELLSHRLKHLLGKQHDCHLCTRRFRTPPYLEYHYRKDHSDGKVKLTLRCNLCDRSYNTPKRLHGHITLSHSTVGYFCDYCNKLCASKSLLKAHIASHMDHKPYVCDLCDYAAKFSSNLKAHKLYKHSPAKVTCKKCRRVFGSLPECNKHTCRQVSTICPVCGKACSDRKVLNRHLQSHEEIGRYKCDRCPATFRSKMYLSVHQDRHDGIRKHECEYCPAKFYSAPVLNKHRRTHTGIKPYVCKVCQKAFTGNHNLKVHMRVHGEYLITKKNSNPEEESK